MKDLLEKCCGLDVHKDIIVACILAGPIGRATISEIREFSTLASGLEELRDWITASGCSHVAIESTGIYWIALYEVLEAVPEKLTLLVVNARHMKNVPGKKMICGTPSGLPHSCAQGFSMPASSRKSPSGNSDISHATVRASSI